MDAEVKRWGNSFAIRLSKRDLERMGIHEGDHVEVTLRKARARKRRVSLEDLPTFRDEDPRASERHDEHLYGDRP